MATSRMKELYALSGITEARDIDQLRDYLTAGFATQWEEVAKQVQNGRISAEVGLDARREIAAQVLEEIASDSSAWALARQPDAFGRTLADNLRNQAGGYESDDSPEGAAVKRRQALDVVLANRADEMFGANQLTAQEYSAAMERLDSGAMTDGRRRSGYDQPHPHDLDRPRDLDQDETGHVAGAAWAKRNGLTQPLEPNSEPEPETDPESGSDWSEDRLEKYFALRDAEREAAQHPHDEQRDPNLRRITAGSPLDALANSNEYKGS
jgi:hypothetical protein